MRIKTSPFLLAIPVILFIFGNRYHWNFMAYLGIAIGMLFSFYILFFKKRYDLILPIAGGFMDLLAIGFNQGVMPVLNANGSEDAVHVALNASTQLKFLCDIIPIGHFMIISIGDVFIFFLWPLYLILVHLMKKGDYMHTVGKESHNA